MKQRLFPFVVLVAFLLTTTALYAKGDKEPGGKAKTGKPNAAREFLDANSKVLDGGGGAGKGLAILVPQTSGLSADDENENYYPSLVQGGFVTSFSKYSGLAVLDRVNLEKVLRETESGIYRDENAFIQLGEIANVDYVMTGTLTKTAPGRFILQMQVAATTADAATKASYSGSCTAEELQNLSAVNRASLDLFGQLGISLTDAARNELLGIGSEESLEAQTALARGITAQRGGNTAKTTVETMFYYSDAQSLDPSLREAAERLSTVQSAVQSTVQAVQKMKEVEKPKILQSSATSKTGNIGKDARNEVERFRAEKAYEEERRKAQAEYDAAVAAYNSALAEEQRRHREDLQAKQREMIDLLNAAEDFLAGHPPFEMRYDPSLEEGTLDPEKETIDLRFYCATIPTSSSMDVLKTILDNLASIEKQMDEAGAQKQAWTHTWKGAEFRFVFSLLDEEDTPIANEEATLYNGLLNGDVLRPMTMIGSVTFRGVDVYKITDTLRIRIDRINGVPVAEGSPSLIKISTARFSDSSYTINGYNRQGWDRGGYYLDGYNKSGYDRAGKDRNGRTLGQNVAAAVHARWEDNEKYGALLEITGGYLAGYTYSPQTYEAGDALGIGFTLGIHLGKWGLWTQHTFFPADDKYAYSDYYVDLDYGEGGSSWGHYIGIAGVYVNLFKNISLDAGIGVRHSVFRHYWRYPFEHSPPVEKEETEYSDFTAEAGITCYFLASYGYYEGCGFAVSGHVVYTPAINKYAFVIGVGLALLADKTQWEVLTYDFWKY
jgi:TolB-like protein